MSKSKLSPRQKMISMMYLVLTAMLAMNLSKEVLNAFVVVNEGIENSNELVNKKSQALYSKLFTELEKETSTKNTRIHKLVLNTQKLTKSSISYIGDIKEEILHVSGVNTNEESNVLFANLDDLETATRILTKSIAGNKPKGELLREELVSINSQYLDIVDEGNPTNKNTPEYIDYEEIFSRSLTLQAPNKNDLSYEGESITWTNKNFFNVPVVATDVILTKIQNDIYSSEAEVLDYLFNQIGADITTFNELSAEVTAPKSYLPVGKSFQANIFVAASSSEPNFEVFIGRLVKEKFNKDDQGKIEKTFTSGKDLFFLGDYKEVPIVKGKAKFEELTSGVGQKSYEGLIRVKKPTGGYDIFPFEFDYEVAPKSSFSVSPTAMNVLYIGLDNPLSITVSGSEDRNVTAVMTKGNILRKDGNWVANVTEQGKTSIDVYGIIDGEKKKIGSQNFRVKRVPDPVATLNGKIYHNTVTKSRAKSHTGLTALMDNFVFNVRYKVVGYDFSLRTSSDVFTEPKVRGALFSKEVKKYIKNAKTNDIIYFTNIVVKGPDGNRKINSISLTIK
jgi:gliding motility-associated protein GldM